MNKFAVIFCLMMMIIAGATLMQISYQVDAKERELSKLTHELIAHEDSIRVLKAEWAYLTQPQRLEKLAANHLALAPTQVAQLQGELPAVQLAIHTPLSSEGLIKVAAGSSAQ